MRRTSIKRWIGCSVAALVIVSLLLPVACAKPAPPAPPAPPKVITWNYSRNSPGSPGSSYHTYTHAPFVDIIATDTGGGLKLIYHEGVVPDTKTIDAVRDGTFDMAVQIVLFRAELALLNFCALPFIPRDKLPEIVELMWPTFTKVMDEEHDVVLLGYGYWGIQRLITKTPVRTLADLKGYKLRAHNPETLELMKAAGASPVFISMPEVYPALQRGVVDGGVTSLEGVMGNKWYEVLKYVSDWPMGNASYIWVANKQSWAALPGDLQDKILKLFKDKYEMTTFTGGLEDDKNQQRELEAMGVQFTKAEPADVEKYFANVPPVFAKWRERAGPGVDELVAAINKTLGTKY